MQQIIPFKKRGPKGATTIIDCIAISCTALSFVIAVMDSRFPFVNSFGSWKWAVFLTFVLYCIVKSKLWLARPTVLWILFGTFIAVSTFSTLRNFWDFREAIMRISSFWFLWMISFVFPLPTHPIDRLRIWTKVMVAISAVVTFTSLIFLYLPHSFVGGRLKGITSNANTLGSFAMITAISGFAFILNGQIKSSTCILAAGGVGCTLLSASRSSMLALLSGILTLIIAEWNHMSMRRSVIVILLSIVTITTATWYTREYTNGPAVWTQREYNLAGRQFIWKTQINAWLKAPFWGHGLVRGTPHVFVLRSDSRGRPSGESSFFDLLAVAGVLGAGPLFIGILLSIVIFFKRKHCGASLIEIDTNPAWTSCLIAFVTAILVNSVGEGYLAAVGNLLAIYIWIVCGVISQVSIERRDTTSVIGKNIK